MHVLAFAHQKGGVGKTTTVAHTAAALARAGHQVIAVDLDPQGSLTRLMGVDPERTLLDAYPAHGAATLDGVAVKVPQWGIEMIPADNSLLHIESMSTIGAEQQLRRLLADTADDPGWVLIDAPGSFGRLTTMALVAASHGVIVPTTPDWLAIDPIGALNQLIGQVRDAYQPGCEIRGVVINAIKPTVDHQGGIRQLEEAFGARVLGHVPHRAAIGTSAASGQPLTDIRTGPSARLRAVYDEIATAIISQGAST